MPYVRVMVQRSREKEQEQQHINETQNILLKGSTTKDARNYVQKASGSFDTGAACNSLLSGILLASRVSSDTATKQLQVFKIPEY